jgi:hypothetical protein
VLLLLPLLVTMSNSGGIYPCILMKRTNSDDGALGWLQYKTPAQFSLTVDSLTIRESESLLLLADFTRPSIDSFHLVKENIVRIDQRDSKNAIAIKINAKQLKELVRELHRKEYPRIINQVVKASSSVLGKRSWARTSIDLPNLNDKLVQEYVLSLLFDPRFEDFVVRLHGVVSGFRGVLDQYKPSASDTDGEQERKVARTSPTIVTEDSSNSSSTLSRSLSLSATDEACTAKVSAGDVDDDEDFYFDPKADGISRARVSASYMT